jgi:hypothetical protein
MTLEEIEALARLAGLQATRENFPDDVAEAAAAAAAIRAALPRPAAPDGGWSGEAWPPPIGEDGS